MSLPLNTHGRISAGGLSGLYKVLSLREALQLSTPLERCLIDLRSESTAPDLDSLCHFGIGGLIADHAIAQAPLPHLHSLASQAVIGEGDAIRIHPSGKANVLFRRGANANTLFVTARCNSLCLMCSQPPRDEEDRWRIAELLDLLPLLDKNLPILGVTGGEPTLLGSGLAQLLERAHSELPDTTFHVLSNGRRFSDEQFTDYFAEMAGYVIWAIPLYGHVAHRHDFTVQANGAFTETIHGLHNLAERGHRAELRIVLHAQTIPILNEIVGFICRNLPFVEHVALMGLEPMGLARTNRDLLWIDPADYGVVLADAVGRLDQYGISVSIYNTQLCILDRSLWRFARQSISDWKNDFAADCDGCHVKSSCSGFFKSADASWRSRMIKPIETQP